MPLTAPDLPSTISLKRASTIPEIRSHEAEDAANAALLAAAPELLHELERAEAVIQTMLDFMSTERKVHVAAALIAAGIAGKDATRYHERWAVIKRATVAPKAPPRL